MRRWLAVAALGAAFLTLPAWGQRRGGVSGGFAGHAGFSGRGSMGGRGPMMMNRSPAFAGVQRGGAHFGNGFGRPSSPFFFHHHHRFFRTWPYAGYYGYPYYSYPWYYGNDSYSADSYQNYPPSDYSNAYLESSREQAEINRLENEVDRLREERDAQVSRPSSAEHASTKAESQPTQLVFRDKRTEEVQNYAIVGQTFWVFSEQRARKIPLTELDIPATKKANDDRGVEFQLPE
ncbi:MAG TPA: hypothetical protein VN948_00205 [Terriglobales bacterium]|nr:hypothetical protein [Terriglobales bacterium]